jgi:hypothetical protein
MFVPVAVGEVAQAVADPGGPAVRRDVRQAHRDHGRRPVDGELQVHHRRTEDLQPLGEHRAVEDQRAAVLLALVVGQIRRCVVGAPLAGELAHGQR